MRRLPIRLRLTLAFSAAMAVVLGAMAFFVYVRVGGALLHSVDQNLRAAASETRDQARSGGGPNEATRPLIDTDSANGLTLAELISSTGRVVRSTPAGLPAFADAATVAQARGSRVLWTTELSGRKGEWRLLAAPLDSGRATPVLVLTSSLASREEALHRLLIELLIAGPIALLIASLAGYGLANAALRPVESMRQRAAAISASTPGRRLPVPAARDEISRLAETLNEMLSRLEAALEHERQFVADASHELRTPLALLRTEIDVALRRTRSVDELEAALRSAREETVRLTRLAEDLLLVARADQGSIPVRREPVRIAEVFDGIAARFASRALHQDRSLVVQAERDLTALADRPRLEQALANMVDNAIVHGRGAVELRAEQQHDSVELHVLDEGPGFPADFRSRAFDRFSRADEARGGSGTGLGLSIVDLIARAHGGRAGVGSRPGGGADVWIVLEAGPLLLRPTPEADPTRAHVLSD
jgi:heavy metal sensor kinase